MKRLLLLVVIAVGNNVHTMQDIKPYDPEGSFKKVIRNGIGVAATLGGAYGVFKKFKEGDVAGSLKYGAVACAGLLCFRVPDFLMNAKEKEKHVEVGRLTSIFVKAKEERHPDFEKFIKNMPVDAMPTISVEYANIVNEKTLKLCRGYRSYMKTKASMGYRIISAIMGFKPWHEDTVFFDEARCFYRREESRKDYTDLFIFPDWVMQYGMPLWNAGTSNNDPQLIADLRELNDIFYKEKKVSLEDSKQESGEKITYANVQSPENDQLLYRLAEQGYPIKYFDQNSYLFYPDSGKPISRELFEEVGALDKILREWSLADLQDSALWDVRVLKKFVRSEEYRNKFKLLLDQSKENNVSCNEEMHALLLEAFEEDEAEGKD